MSTVAKKSIIRKVVRRVVLVVCITVLALSSANLIYMTNQLSSEVETELELVSMLSAEKLDGWCLELEGITLDIADTITGLQTLDETTIKHILNQYASHHENLFFLYVATEDGDMYMARGVQFAAGVDVRQRGWYKQAKAAGHTIITDPYMSATRADVMLATVATPIFFGTKMVGVVGVDADVATINEYVGSIRFKEGAYGFLIDGEGNILAHKNEAFRPTVSEKTNVVDVIPELTGLIQKPGSGMAEGIDYEGTDMLYCTSRLRDCKWIVGLAYPRKYMYKTLDRGIRICLMAAVLCLILAIGIIYGTVRKMLIPIRKINPVLEGIMQGDFSVPIEITKEEDELGQLQTVLAIITRKLAEIIQDQKHVLGEMEKGNLIVEDIESLPGELNDISTSVNSIKATFNDIISDIQFSAINLQSFAMGVNETSNLEEMKMIFEELSAEANALMEKTSRFITMPGGPVPVDYKDDDDTDGEIDEFRDDF